ncbi:phosphate ABC transporter substrate-binding protein PstS [Geodermatophilus marinus]|uniref:phosphate ABC transporter substrate-binding protein PstS n=1 Tax=Geodermatophilus sp. LHW52908 TaxID=2303986 RepID=UPI000E3BFA6E|nr:phosphate ABC transporter substrate-binding protein PstS [Geodermatophilus sp. LHW52908]RFU22108.1 phosphate ABC transporter substrate-binding protein PstS [Geodermatophilus sp. LHW52908]
MSARRKLVGLAGVAVVAGGVAVAATWTPPNERRTPVAAGDRLEGELVGAGASSQQAAMQGWLASYSAVQPDVRVSYDPVGSGGGREQFLAGGVDFAGSDAALDEEELAEARERCGDAGVFELPNYIAPIAVVFQVPGVDELQLSPETLAGIFSGAITRWDDPAVVGDNPGTALPDLRISPVHRSDESGTTENFTAYLAETAGAAWPYEPEGEWPLPGGEAAQGNSGVVAAVAGGEGTIGYADLSQAGDLGVAAVRVGDTYVGPTAEAAAAVVAGSPRREGRGPADLAIELDRGTAEGYPIVLVSYHIGCVEYADQQTADLVRSFLGHVISEEGQEAAAEVAGSAPISDELREQARPVVDSIRARS